MAKKKENKFYSPSEQDIEYAKYCTKRDLAIVITPIPDKPFSYWVCKYKISDYRNISFLRQDLSLPDTKYNRQVFNEHDALKKTFELYKQFHDKNNK